MYACSDCGGHAVAEMVVDYQTQTVGGDVWLRLIAFLPNGRTVHARSYSPPYDEYKTDTQDQFKFTLE